jgi:GNAT superfamily N-acetyltransferase
MLALHPAENLPPFPGVLILKGDGFRLDVTRWPGAQIVHPLGEGPRDVAAAVAETRSLGREHGKEILAWWIAPEHDRLMPALERLGLANEDAGGYESVENALALVTPPPAGPTDVEVRLVETWEDYVGATEVALASFGTPPLAEHELRAQYADLTRPGNHEHAFVALVDGRVVGSGFGALAEAGMNLFGGAVLAGFRGRGVYRALLRARWGFAAAHGAPALTLQAGRMSLPICERAGFRLVGRARLFADRLR